MEKKKKDNVDPISDYQIITNKQLRWIVCREIAEMFYRTHFSYEELKEMKERIIPETFKI